MVENGRIKQTIKLKVRSLQDYCQILLYAGLLGIVAAVVIFFRYLKQRRSPSAVCFDLVKQLVPMFQAASLWKMEEAYIQFVLQRFKPQSYQKISTPKPHASLAGDALLVPSLNESAHYLLKPQLSGSSYTSDDVYWVELVRFIACEVESSKRQKSLGVQEERQRIRRDLHDELTQDLIALMRSADGEPQTQLANSAMSSLKNILSALSEEEMLLQDFLVAAQAQMRERLLMHDMSLEWFEKNVSSDDIVTAKEVSNVLKILKEASCNVVKHTDTDRVKVVVNQFANRLDVRIENRIVEKPEVKDSNQLGMQNMETRIRELNGDLKVMKESGVFVLQFSFPLEEAREG